MPSPDWEANPLAVLCHIVSGGTPPKSNPDLWRGTFPWASGKDLKRLRLSDTKDHITEAAAAEYSKIAPAGSVLVLVRGMGLANGFALSMIDRPMAFNQDLKALIPKAGVSGAFLMYALTWKGWQMLQNVTDAAHGTKRLSQDDITAFSVSYPEGPEQGVVVRALDTVQAGIELERHARRLYERLKATTVHRLFTRGLRGEEQKEVSGGLIPESWELAQLGDHVTDMQYGLSVRGQAQGQTPILRMNCQVNGRVVYRDLQYVDLDEETTAAFRLTAGDLLFNRTNSYELVGRMALVEDSREAVFASYLIRVVVDRSVFNPAFVNHYFNRADVQASLRGLASRGVSQANINATKLRGVWLPKPPLEEQDEIVAVLDELDRKIELHRRKEALLDQLFRALLHQLMTRSIRASDLDLTALPAVPEVP